MSEKDIDYDALSERYADPSVPVVTSGPALTGEAAAAAGRDFAIAEYGSVEAMEAEIRRGRPRIGTEPVMAATARTVRATLSDADYAAFEELRRSTGARQATLVRNAIHEYLSTHKAS